MMPNRSVAQKRKTQFWACVEKCALVKTRRPGRIPGVASLILEILLPSLFILVRYGRWQIYTLRVLSLPKHYIKPIPSSEHTYALHEIDEPSWGVEYTGPGAKRYAARVLVTPNTSSTTELLARIAQGAACPTNTAKSNPPSSSFYRYFGQPGRPSLCTLDGSTCRETEMCWKGLLGTHFVLFESVNDAIAEALRNPNSVDAVLDLSPAAASLTSADASSTLRYSIHMNHSTVPLTQSRYDVDNLIPIKYDAQYWWFVNLQSLVDAALISEATNMTTAALPLLGTSVKSFPTPARLIDIGGSIVASFFGILLLFAYLLPTRSIVEVIVQEKELHLRAGLRLLGLDDINYWGSWAFVHLAGMGISSLLCAGVAMYPFSNSSFVLLALFLWTISLSLMIFAFFVSTFFKTARVAGNSSQLLLVVAMLPSIVATSLQPYGGALWSASCLLPPAAVQMFANVIVVLSERNEGLTFGSLFRSVAIESEFSAATVLAFLWLDVAIFGTLTWYLDKVLPSGVGQPLRWDFFLQRAYYCRSPVNEWGETANSQPILPDDSAAIQTSDLTMKFWGNDGTCTVAVDAVNVTFPKDKITGLLGRNGAGKTTMLSILTGLLSPSSGEAFINGMSVTHDPDRIRGHVGICPQFDVLWPSLTVREHIGLFAGIKGCPREDLENLVTESSSEVGLLDKLDAWISTLSGGQKRKLSLALAFLGSPDVVFLDEPTSGMDPRARRAAWEVIRRRRGSTSIVLTTHFMEEADSLSDYVVIMSDGKIAAEGSPLRLKSQHGVGYILRCGLSASASESSAGLQPVVEQLANFVCSRAPQAEVAESSSSEVAFSVPTKNSAVLPDLLRALNAEGSAFGVRDLGLSMTTLESVFLRVCEASAGDGHHGAESVGVSIPESVPHQVDDRFLRKFAALFWKDTLSTFRDRLTLCSRLVVPIACAALALMTAQFQKSLSMSAPALEFSPARTLGHAPVLVGASNQSRGAQLDAFLGSFDASWLLLSNATDILRKASLTHLEGTLDLDLLNDWFHSPDIFGAAFIDSVPPKDMITALPLSFAVLANYSGVHALPATLALVHSGILRWLTNGSFDSILPSSQPLPFAPTETIVIAAGLVGTVVLVILTLSGLSSFSASFARSPVRERVSGSKQLLMLAGTPPLALWLAQLLSDLAVYSIVGAGMLLCFAFEPGALSSARCLSALSILLSAYGAASISVTYLLQNFFEDEDKALRGLASVYTWIGTLGYIAVKILTLLTSYIPVGTAVSARDILKGILLVISPQFGLAYGIDEIASFASGEANWTPWQQTYDPFTWTVLGKSVTLLLVQCIVCMSLVVLLDAGVLGALLRVVQRIFGSRKRIALEGGAGSHNVGPIPEDADCAAEVEAMLHRNSTSPALAIQGARKTFGRGSSQVAAVENLWLQIESGQCFGLLGTNGAGKTTTFKLLVGEEAPDSGDILIDGRSIVKESRACGILSYCPQQSALPSLLSGKEVLTVYAHVRGIPSANITPLVSSLLDQLGLWEIADQACGTYSGGNRRKLSVAVSILAAPRITLMDEPSTGMDPASRRSLWRVLRSRVLDNNTIVLSSHSMEECEAVCGRVGIMIKGVLRCLGSIQHLKSRFGQGYTVTIEVSPGRSEELLRHFKEMYPSLLVHASSGTLLTFNVPVGRLELPELIEQLEERRQHGISDYSVSQASLEQVFLGMSQGA